MVENSQAHEIAAIAHGARDAAVSLSRNSTVCSDVPDDRPKARESVKPTTPRAMQADEPVRAFVSWAHKGETWDDAQSASWARDVVEFTTRLRSNGIDAELDLFHTHETSTDWTRFGQTQVEAADFVVVVLSEAWAQRWAGTNNPKVGAGAVVECDTLKGIQQRDQDEFQRKVLIVILPSQQDEKLPPDLARINRFYVDPDDTDTLDDLLRSMTDQPTYVKAELGHVPVLPPAVRSTLKVRTSKQRTDEYSSFLAIRREISVLQKRHNLGNKDNDRLLMLLGLMDALED